jgi:hypothetical protein
MAGGTGVMQVDDLVPGHGFKKGSAVDTGDYNYLLT